LLFSFEVHSQFLLFKIGSQPWFLLLFHFRIVIFLCTVERWFHRAVKFAPSVFSLCISIWLCFFSVLLDVLLFVSNLCCLVHVIFVWLIDLCSTPAWCVIAAKLVLTVYCAPLLHLHCLYSIFILSYYYIYNDLFNVNFLSEWCKFIFLLM